MPLRASLLVTLLLLTRAFGQATQPVPPAAPAEPAPEPPNWSQIVAHLADQLSGKDLAALRSAVGPDCVIRNFASDSPTTPERLLASTATAKLIGTHAYPGLPGTLASDLAGDFRNAKDVVPEMVQKEMVPGDATLEKKANETAAAWIAQVLNPVQSRVVGVIIFWPTDRRLPGDTAPRRAIFVVVKAQLINGIYIFQQVRFGDPLEPPR